MRAMIIVWVHRSWLETTWGRDMHKWSWSFFLRKWTNCHLKRDHFLERTRVIFQASILRGSVSFRFFFLEDHHLKKHQFYDSKNSVDHFSKTTLCRLGLKLTALNVSFSQPWSCRSNGGWRCVFGPTSGANFVPTFSQEAPTSHHQLVPRAGRCVPAVRLKCIYILNRCWGMTSFWESPFYIMSCSYRQCICFLSENQTLVKFDGFEEHLPHRALCKFFSGAYQVD